jgi:hypothetical protein
LVEWRIPAALAVLCSDLPPLPIADFLCLAVAPFPFFLSSGELSPSQSFCDGSGSQAMHSFNLCFSASVSLHFWSAAYRRVRLAGISADCVWVRPRSGAQWTRRSRGVTVARALAVLRLASSASWARRDVGTRIRRAPFRLCRSGRSAVRSFI